MQRLRLEMGHLLELREAGVDLGQRQPLQPLAPERLDRERRDHGAVDRGPAEHLVRRARSPRDARPGSRRSHPANESPAPVGSTTVSSGYPGTKKNPLCREHACSVAPLLDDEHARAEARRSGVRRARGSAAPVSIRTSVSFRETTSTQPDRLDQRVARRLDPVVHRVEAGDHGSRCTARGRVAAGRAGCSRGRSPATPARPERAPDRTRRRRSAACRGCARPACPRRSAPPRRTTAHRPLARRRRR